MYSYNLERPHYGEGMDGKPPFQVLRELGYDLPPEFALLPPLVLDRVSAYWALRDGNDLLAHYMRLIRIWNTPAPRGGWDRTGPWL